MATRRGASNQDRLALDIVHVSADASLVLAPCFLYAINVALIDTSATGKVVIADSSASGDALNESAKWVFKLGPLGASGGTSGTPVVFQKPVYIQKTLVADITNAEVSVQYLAAS